MTNYELWVIEVHDGDTPELLRRYDEHGEGSPLTWPRHRDAQDVITGMVEADASYRHILRPVRLAGASGPLPAAPATGIHTSPFESAERFLRGPDGY